jgi:hypothetical protein
VTRPTRETIAGQRYLALQREARRTNRPTDELIQIYALECFLDRLVRSRYADQFVLKGGMLLAALGARRPTRDIDFSAHAVNNNLAEVLHIVRDIAASTLDDGVVFDSGAATAETIREEDDYSGVRTTLSGALSRASIRLHVDVNVGDPVWPEAQSIEVPRLLDGALLVRGYPVEMVLAEKLVTAIVRGTVNTRWRDFLDIHALAACHAISGARLHQSLVRVADHRAAVLASLETLLAGFGSVAQPRWRAWADKQRLPEDSAPRDFATVLQSVIAFADPVIAGDAGSWEWDPATRQWR